MLNCIQKLLIKVKPRFGISVEVRVRRIHGFRHDVRQCSEVNKLPLLHVHTERQLFICNPVRAVHLFHGCLGLTECGSSAFNFLALKAQLVKRHMKSRLGFEQSLVLSPEHRYEWFGPIELKSVNVSCEYHFHHHALRPAARKLRVFWVMF
ncbi:hypothetical protein [Acidovorax sp.]|uniref:hypothetical protein n=1 Tax=Acidovorax sp. TaxID=1872122 RepID=UPI0040376262